MYVIREYSKKSRNLEISNTLRAYVWDIPHPREICRSLTFRDLNNGNQIPFNARALSHANSDRIIYLNKKWRGNCGSIPVCSAQKATGQCVREHFPSVTMGYSLVCQPIRGDNLRVLIALSHVQIDKRCITCISEDHSELFGQFRRISDLG